MLAAWPCQGKVSNARRNRVQQKRRPGEAGGNILGIVPLALREPPKNTNGGSNRWTQYTFHIPRIQGEEKEKQDHY